MEFLVSIPLNATVTVVVEAESEEEAKHKALDEIDLVIESQSDLGYEINQWQAYDKLLQGNVWHGIIYEADAEPY